MIFGGFRDGRQPIDAYHWIIDGQRLLEIPVTTMPFFKVPIHVSYALYLSVLSPALSAAYFSTALSMRRMAGVEPSILLHPLDFLGEDAPELAFFPAMGLPAERKLGTVGRFLDCLSKRLRAIPLGIHAHELLERGASGKCRQPRRPEVLLGEIEGSRRVAIQRELECRGCSSQGSL